jgi:hypothetical protein
MTPRTPQCEVFCPFLSSSKHSGVPEDSQPPTFPSVGLHPHTWPKWGCDNDHAIKTKTDGSSTSISYEDTDDSERSDPESNQLQQIDCENEFEDTKLEELVESKGPQEILQLII